jgi:LacI family transcriptional regulator
LKKRTTIKDIAEAAGVSATAVSMALNHSPRISRGTKERILGIAETMHYRPNYAARSLAGRRSNTLGLVITTIMNPFYPELAKGIEDRARERGYNIILCSTNYDASREKDFINILRSKGVDGIIFSSVEMDDPYLKPLIDDAFPFVLVNRRVAESTAGAKLDYVVLDNVSGGAIAIRHLYNLGHRRIAIIAGSLNSSTGMERTQGAQKALAECGLSLDPGFIVECGFSKERAYDATRRLLPLSPAPTAVFAQNDYMALGVRDAVLDAGLSIPKDVALVGFDNIEAAAIRGVEITTINQKKYEMGATAVEFLIEKIEGKTDAVRQIVLPAEIVIRSSCGFKREAVCEDRGDHAALTGGFDG